MERWQKRVKARYGTWAVITGASDGIGLEFVRRLASAGIHLMLAARREDKLREVAAQLENDHTIRTQVLAVDLATDEGNARLLAETSTLDVGLFVAAADFGDFGPLAIQTVIKT